MGTIFYVTRQNQVIGDQVLEDIESNTDGIEAILQEIADNTASSGGGGGGDASAANQVAQSTLIGAVTETAPASDTASSGLNGRLQRIAQRLASLIALLPTSLGQKTAANSLAVTLASDQSAVPTLPTVPSVAAMTRVAINAALSGDNQLVAGTASQTIRVHKLFLVVTGAVNIKFRSGTTDFHPALPLQAGGGMTLDFDGEPWYITTVAEALNLNLSGAVQVSGYLYYTKSA